MSVHIALKGDSHDSVLSNYFHMGTKAQYCQSSDFFQVTLKAQKFK